MAAKAFAGFVILDQAHKSLLDAIRSELQGSGSRDLLKEFDSLRRVTVFGRTVMRQSERDQLNDLLSRIHSSRKEEIEMQSKEYKLIEADLDEAATGVTAALAEARSLNRDLKKLDARLESALRKSKVLLDKSIPAPR